MTSTTETGAALHSASAAINSPMVSAGTVFGSAPASDTSVRIPSASDFIRS